MVRIKGGRREQRAVFLSALAAGLSVGGAAESCEVSRATLYRWRDRSERFTLQWHDAVQDGTDTLEDEALRRATMGTARPVFWKGEQVGEVRQYNDRLLMFLLQARRPEVYRLPPGAPPPELPTPRVKLERLDALIGETQALLDKLRALDTSASAAVAVEAPRIADAPVSPVNAHPPAPEPRAVPQGPAPISAMRTAQHSQAPKDEAVNKEGPAVFSPMPRHGGGGRRPEGEPTWSLLQGSRGLPSAPAGHLPSKAGEENFFADAARRAAAATRGDVKSGLAHTLARLCRAGVEAVTASILPMPPCDHPPRLSHLSQIAHPMPIPRAFPASTSCLIGRRNETEQAPTAALWHRISLGTSAIAALYDRLHGSCAGSGGTRFPNARAA